MTRNLWQHIAACSLGWSIMTVLRIHTEPAVLYIPDAVIAVLLLVAVYKGFIQENAVH